MNATYLKGKLEEIYDSLRAGYLDVRVASKQLKDTVLRCLEEYTDQEHAIPKEERVRLISHYTSINTLVSMLQSTISGEKSFLRMYDSVHSNDPDEGNFINRYLPQKYASLIGDGVSHAYVASFVLSRDGEDKSNDNLAFWRTYGKDGEGCSLSLSLSSLPETSRLSSSLRKVRYDHQSVKDLECNLESLFKDSDLEYFINKIGKFLPDIRVVFDKVVGEHIGKIRYLYKSGAYKYENECRFVLLGSDIESSDVRFECLDKNGSQARIRHYYEHEDLNIKSILISGGSIVIGPCVSHPNDVKYCIETLLKRAELPGPSVTVSGIKYRKP